MSNIEVRQLRVLVALTEHGSLTAAARALGLAQSTASEAVAALERAVGTPVVRRRRKAGAAILTEAGLALLPHARAVLASLESAHLAVAPISARANSSLAITANESIGTYLLARVLPGLRARWPRTRFAVAIATCPGVYNAVAAGEADIGVFLGDGDALGAVPEAPAGHRFPCRVLGRGVALAFFAQPLHPLVARSSEAPVRRHLLADFPLFISDAAGECHALVSRFFEGDALPEPAFEVAGTIQGVKDGVAGDSRAVGLLPEYALRDDIASGRFAVVRTRPAAPSRDVVAVTAKAGARHPAAAELLDQLACLLTPA